MGFLFVVLFIAFYSLVFYKKMDMVFFPYNSMYTIDFTRDNTATTYAMKINGSNISITDRLYWKKDFLETSLYGYCKYISRGNTVFLEDYLRQRFSNTVVRSILLNRLTADKTTALDWPHWYGRFAGHDIPPKASIELWQYNFKYEAGKALLKDSISIYKTTLP